MHRHVAAFAILAAVALPTATQAQGLVGGAERGYHAGNHALGPIGGIVGGAVGAGVGTVNGALGIHPRYFYYHGRRCYYSRHHRVCR